MNYKLARKLKDNGFPQTTDGLFWDQETRSSVAYPTLSELIEACGNNFCELTSRVNQSMSHHSGDYESFDNLWPSVYWVCSSVEYKDEKYKSPYWGEGETPEEAVANLWLELNKHD